MRKSIPENQVGANYHRTTGKRGDINCIQMSYILEKF